MAISGKVIGGIAGFAVGGPFGAFVGAVAGHAVDYIKEAQPGGKQSRGVDSDTRHIALNEPSYEPEATAVGRHEYHKFIIDRKEPESENITSFYLKPDDGPPLPEFLPGQFLKFKLDIPGQQKPVIRNYSLSDRRNPHYYRISVKREPTPADRSDLPPGLSSNYFHDNVNVGTKLRAVAPRGKFHIDQAIERAVVLYQCWSGIDSHGQHDEHDRPQ